MPHFHEAVHELTDRFAQIVRYGRQLSLAPPSDRSTDRLPVRRARSPAGTRGVRSGLTAAATAAGLIEKDQAGAAIRVGRCEEHAQAGARAAAPQHGAPGPGCIHDRPDVVHRRLESDCTSRTRGEAHAALVEHQHSAEGGQALDVADEQPLLPGREQVPGPDARRTPPWTTARRTHSTASAGQEDVDRDDLVAVQLMFVTARRRLRSCDQARGGSPAPRPKHEESARNGHDREKGDG